MGLDISYFKNITKAKGKEGLDDQGDSDWENGWRRVTVIPEFSAAADDLKDRDRIKGEEGEGFRAGSYIWFNGWRTWLAGFAGYRSHEYVWEHMTEGDFYELINFSDCEGTIGAKTSAKLAADFKKHADRLPTDKAVRDYVRRYKIWMSAFEIAAQNGCVLFH